MSAVIGVSDLFQVCLYMDPICVVVYGEGNSSMKSGCTVLNVYVQANL